MIECLLTLDGEVTNSQEMKMEKEGRNVLVTVDGQRTVLYEVNDEPADRFDWYFEGDAVAFPWTEASEYLIGEIAREEESDHEVPSWPVAKRRYPFLEAFFDASSFASIQKECAIVREGSYPPGHYLIFTTGGDVYAAHSALRVREGLAVPRRWFDSQGICYCQSTANEVNDCPCQWHYD